MEIYIDDSHGSSRERPLSMLTNLIDGRVHSPEYLRGMAVLNIETEIGGENSFVFLPAIDRVQFAVAETDRATLETRYYTRASRTDLLLHDLKIKPKLDDHVFSLKTRLRETGGLPEVAR